MADTLVIVESPAKAKTIGKYLGSKYIVRASMGHVRDLPKSEMGVAVDNAFAPKYITIRGKGEMIKALKAARKKVKRVVLAADPDREGEAIAWHLAHYLDIPEHEPCRVVFHEITKQAVKDAFAHPRPIDMHLVHAQQARRILDRLVGYNISPLLWKKVKKGLSAGRVQSVAVKIILDREREIQQFIPEEYWTITAHVRASGGSCTAKYVSIDGEKKKLSSKEDADAVMARMHTDALYVTDVREKQRLRHSPPPFTTSTLQQEAGRKLGFRAVKTMLIAQQLYEGVDIHTYGTLGLITYLRTDSTRVSQTASDEARAHIRTAYGDQYVPASPRVHTKKNAAQDAHEAIRPTTMALTPASIKDALSRDQYRLYELIWNRFIASQMAPAVFDTVTATLEHEGVVFRAHGSRIQFPGFLQAYSDLTEEEKAEAMLPQLRTGDRVALLGLDPKQHFTMPPPRYTESRLVKELEERGIGRPSTYAPTIETIKKRGYVAIEEKAFVPTELGELVIGQMELFFPEILNLEFTATMEAQLDEIGHGNQPWVDVLQQFYDTLSVRLGVAHEQMQQLTVRDEEAGESCTECGKPLLFKMGRYGKFIACSGFPDCRNVKPIVRSIGVTCPKCHEGAIVERRSKKGRVFFGCSAYPTCDYTSWDQPLSTRCAKCEGTLVKKMIRKQPVSQCVQCHERTPMQTS
ncbi:MAG: type I DNA topoisomerase [Paenibacillaceae bacterium]|nr:type I DNA topoisomerase [Paenibacillaceae bacterium]